mmetsp:Transcript_81697/g.142097  ORF Transcript_81697/g.142097 Transcript_81697/m.142097 type:complete len:212 (-) Transcript_81697:390-1025(-)
MSGTGARIVALFQQLRQSEPRVALQPQPVGGQVLPAPHPPLHAQHWPPPWPACWTRLAPSQPLSFAEAHFLPESVCKEPPSPFRTGYEAPEGASRSQLCRCYSLAGGSLLHSCRIAPSASQHLSPAGPSAVRRARQWLPARAPAPCSIDSATSPDTPARHLARDQQAAREEWQAWPVMPQKRHRAQPRLPSGLLCATIPKSAMPTMTGELP